VRAARSIIESKMLDIAFHLPDKGPNLRYTITHEFMRGEAPVGIEPIPSSVRRESA
jgi:ATP-dependent protease Clp ATPase subunit